MRADSTLPNKTYYEGRDGFQFVIVAAEDKRWVVSPANHKASPLMAKGRSFDELHLAQKFVDKVITDAVFADA